MTLRIESSFPDLKAAGYRVTSRETEDYNCFAWAAGRSGVWMEPFDGGPGYYWPCKTPQLSYLQVFIEGFEQFGFVCCEDDTVEDGFEKIALFKYPDEDEVTHAARQLPDGKWTSKLGDWEDIEHLTLDGLVSDDFGVVAQIMKRRKPSHEQPQKPPQH